MSLRKSKFLIRAVLLIICFQFTAASFLSVELGGGGSITTISAHKVSKPLSLTSLIEKTEKEGEERDEDVAIEIPDLSFFAFNYQTSVQTSFYTELTSHNIQKPSFQRLYCVFLI